MNGSGRLGPIPFVKIARRVPDFDVADSRAADPPGVGPGSTTWRISARPSRFRHWYRPETSAPSFGVLLKVGRSEHVERCRQSTLSARACPVQRHVHRFCDRGCAQFRSRGAERFFVSVNQMLCDRPRICESNPVYLPDPSSRSTWGPLRAPVAERVLKGCIDHGDHSRDASVPRRLAPAVPGI